MIIKDRKKLQAHIEQLKKQGKKIVFTNGCFDILHKGHVVYLTEAKKLGDVLVVGINSDDSVTKLKGYERPLVSLDSRMCVLDSLKMVDIVTPFSEDKPMVLIKIVRPDVHVKGGDYKADDLPEAETVRSVGGLIKIIPFVGAFSVTSIVEKIRKNTQRH